VATYAKRAGGWRAQVRKLGVSESKTFPTKAMAVAWATDRERELATVAVGGLPNKTLRDTLERYHDEVSPQKRGGAWEQSRIAAWLGRINKKTGKPSANMLPWLDTPVHQITTTQFAEWRDDRLRVVSNGTVLRELNLIGSILKRARVEWKWLAVNPLTDMARPSDPPPRTRRISDAEIAAMCIALGWEENRIRYQTQEVAAAFLLAIETAMRQGEMLKMTWDDVDLVNRTVVLPMTKNGSARTVPLSSRAFDILMLLRGRDDVKVFTVVSKNCDSLFRKCRARAGVSGFSFHDTRREATSRLAKKVDVLTLARITGHKDINQLMTYYQTDMSDVAATLG
jgi:integrase